VSVFPPNAHRIFRRRRLHGALLVNSGSEVKSVSRATRWHNGFDSPDCDGRDSATDSDPMAGIFRSSFHSLSLPCTTSLQYVRA
jgi:hypothetical protein